MQLPRAMKSTNMEKEKVLVLDQLAQHKAGNLISSGQQQQPKTLFLLNFEYSKQVKDPPWHQDS